jgi:ParB family chromosome partitioning protein
LAVEDDNQAELARVVADKGLTVRETEALVKKSMEPEKAPKVVEKDPDIDKLEKKLAKQLKNTVSIKHNAKGRGKLTISYQSLADLETIIGQIQ